MKSSSNKCLWCEVRNTTDQYSNVCASCLIESLQKIGWSDKDIKISVWGIANKINRPHLEFNSLSEMDKSKVLNHV